MKLIIWQLSVKTFLQVRMELLKNFIATAWNFIL